jgi:hypothetical protein
MTRVEALERVANAANEGHEEAGVWEVSWNECRAALAAKEPTHD